MTRTWKRLIIAAMFSATGLLTTVQWHRWSSAGDLFGRDERTPIAMLSYGSSGVERRGRGQVIWQDAAVGEELFEGEAIRTSKKSEARIQFNDSEIVVNLEPQSLVVLERNSVDFRAGNLFLNLGTGSGQEFKITSDQGEISSKSGSLNVGRNIAGDLNLQVMAGQASVRSQDKVSTMDTNAAATLSTAGVENLSDLIVVEYPKPSDEVYVDFEKQDKVNFSWRPLEPGYKLYLKSGKDRNADRFVKSERSFAAGEAGAASIDFPYNHKYWQLVAEFEQEENAGDERPDLLSPILPINLVRVRSPFPRAPSRDETITLSSFDESVRFLWSNRMQYKSLYIEISDNPSLADAELIELAQDQSRYVPELHMHSFKKAGDYYWRLTGYIDGYEGPITNPVQKFKVQVGINLAAPELLQPLDGARIARDQAVDQGVFLRWQNAQGVKTYRVVVEEVTQPAGEPIVDEQLTQSFFPFPRAEPGEYTWKVYSLDGEAESEASPKRVFKIEDVPVLAWIEERNTHSYTSKEPTLNLGFQRGPEEATAWQIKVSSDGASSTNEEWVRLGASSLREFQGQQVVYWEQSLPKDGNYFVQARALDAEGVVLAQSKERSILVQEKPRLAPPEFSSRLPASIEAGQDGSLVLAWEKVEGGKSYLVEVRSQSSDSLVTEQKFSRTSGRIVNLLPGTYSVRLRTIDEYERLGPAGEDRQVIVPDMSNIEAPTIQQIKVN